MDEREMFEAWAMGEFALAALPTREGLGYKLIGVDDAWTTWQASWQACRRTTPDREAWISVSESVPQTADFVLAVNKLGAIKCAQYWHGEWIGMGGVTHWMPLPAAPTSDKGGA